jgi:L-ascorbate metabolism protein UlaG (beta-lactamase superfamily)
MSAQALRIDSLQRLDDIIITHEHGDHCDIETIKTLVHKFPDVRITSTPDVVAKLKERGIAAGSEASKGIQFFDSPHENVQPMSNSPQQVGVHYLDLLSDPGDSHSFTETKQILALPVTAPWGTSVRAINLALRLKPKHVLPIHDWHWSDEARKQSYDRFEHILGPQGITFHKLETGKPITIETG